MYSWKWWWTELESISILRKNEIIIYGMSEFQTFWTARVFAWFGIRWEKKISQLIYNVYVVVTFKTPMLLHLIMNESLGTHCDIIIEFLVLSQVVLPFRLSWSQINRLDKTTDYCSRYTYLSVYICTLWVKD